MLPGREHAFWTLNTLIKPGITGGRMFGQLGLRMLPLFVVALFAGMVTLFAGEPIVIGKEKPKSENLKESPFTKELLRPWQNSGAGSPVEGFTLPSIPRVDSSDPRRDRKRRLHELEKKNWMTVQPGELQEEEDAKHFLGVRDYDLEKEEDSDKLMFGELQKKPQTSAKTQTGRQNTKENQNAQQKQQQRDAEELQRELESRRAARDAATKGPNGAEYGAHTASELNFKGLFGPVAGSSERSGLSEVLGGQQNSRGQQALRDEFKAFLNGKPQNASGASGGDLINSWRNDATRQALNPAIAKPAESKLQNDMLGFSANRAANPFSAPAGFDGGFKTPNSGLGLGTPVQPAQRWAPAPTAAEISRSIGMHR